MKLAIFGGTFDPWHLGHELVLQRVCAGALADRILVVPAAAPPHKPPPRASFSQRLAMAAMALRDHPMVGLSDIEHRLPRPSYTLHTIRRLQKEQPESSFALILGADAFLDLHRWYAAADLLSMVELLVLTRPPWGREELKGQEGRLRRLCPRDLSLRLVAGTESALSSSEVRRRLALGDDPAELVPPGVADYIRRQGLYDVSFEGIS